MEIHKAEIIGLNNFYQINIPVSECFYNDLKRCGEVLLSTEFDEGEIIDFGKYFKHSVSLIFKSETLLGSHKILECILEDIDCF